MLKALTLFLVLCLLICPTSQFRSIKVDISEAVESLLSNFKETIRNVTPIDKDDLLGKGRNLSAWGQCRFVPNCTFYCPIFNV